MPRISSKIEYSDLTGGLNNVNSPDTINSSNRKTETPEIVNVEFFELGGIKSMEGNTQIGQKQDSPVIGGWEYTKGNNKYMLIGCYNGEVKMFNQASSEFDLIYKFPSKASRMSFCNMNNGVVITNGIDDLVFFEKDRRQAISGTVKTTKGSAKVTGTGTKFKLELSKGDKVYINKEAAIVDTITSDTELTLTKAFGITYNDVNCYLGEISLCNATLKNSEDQNVNTPIRGLAIQYYNGRLWVGTDNGLFWSQVGKYNGWDIKYDAGVLYSVYNDTSEIKALGLYSDYMLVHKEFNTYILLCKGDSKSIQISPYSNVSCDSQQSWIVSNTKYFVYSKENMDIYPLSQRTVFNDRYIGEPLTKKVRNIFKHLRDADTDKIFCVTLPRKRWMCFYLPLVDYLGSSYALVYDFQTKSFLVRLVPQEVTIAFNYNNNIYLGTQDGLVLKEYAGSSFNGKAIRAYYKSPWFSFLNGYTQSFAEFAMEIAEDYYNKFYIRTFKDGLTPHEDRIIDSEKLYGDALVWDGIQDLPNNDTVWDEDVWVTASTNYLRMLLPNNVFSNFQIEIGTEELGQGFAVYGYQFRRIETEEAPW